MELALTQCMQYKWDPRGGGHGGGRGGGRGGGGRGGGGRGGGGPDNSTSPTLCRR